MVAESSDSAFTPSARCQIIAALDCNHNGSPDLARRLIDAAREAGADGVKFLKRTISQSAVRQVLDFPAPRYNSVGSTYRKALESTDLTVDALASLCEQAKGLQIFMAPYDLEAFHQLDSLPFTAWKVDSPMTTHLPLLRALGTSGRPLVASVAGCNQREVEELLAPLSGEVTLLHTLLMYPFAAGIYDVAYLVPLRRFGRPVGYGDNSLDSSLCLAAVAFGATVIEKPLTLDRGMAGPDHASSLTPQQLSELVQKIRALETVLRSEKLRQPSPSEMDDLEWSRVSIVAAQAIPRGTTITPEMLTLKSPCRGLSPRFLDFVLGRRAVYDLSEDEFITFGMID